MSTMLSCAPAWCVGQARAADPEQHCYTWTESDGVDVLDTTAVG
jgi:hypothetical protein